MSKHLAEERISIAWLVKQGVPFDTAMGFDAAEVRDWTQAFEEVGTVQSLHINGQSLWVDGGAIAAATLKSMHPTRVCLAGPYYGGEAQ